MGIVGTHQQVILVEELFEPKLDQIHLVEGLGQGGPTRGLTLLQAVAAIGSELCDVGVEEVAVGAVGGWC